MKEVLQKYSEIPYLHQTWPKFNECSSTSCFLHYENQNVSASSHAFQRSNSGRKKKKERERTL